MEEQIRQLLAAMTLEEKAGLCSGADFWHTKAVARLGIPAIKVSDGPHGLRAQREDGESVNDSIEAVCFPAGCATAASFDPDVLRREGEALGHACRAEGVDVLLGPAVNIKRSPLCGRNFEYYSEDPYLAGELAAAFIQGVQSTGTGTSIKHFAANNQETRRMSCSSEVSERALREIYLPAFETAVRDAAPRTVMCSYNRINGTYASENPRLLTEILRDEWGFAGIVMSDWGAVADRVRGLQAGLELEMPASDGINDAKIVEAVRSGALEEAVLDKAVARLLRVILQQAACPRTGTFDREADHALAAELAKDCGVLLQNRGVLPLRAGQKVAYIGGFAEAPRFQGGGSSHIRVHRVDSALQAAGQKGRAVRYVQGFPADRDQRDENAFLQAVEAAAAADVAVIFAGLPESFESEGFDRRHMRLPECQNNLIARVAAVQKNTVVVLHTGAPVECPWADDVAAVLCMYLGGEGVGTATDALLWGEHNPSGRLPESWPLRLEDTPCYLDFPGDGRTVPYREGVYVGYRWYDARNMPVRWPFGHGLSYTGFVYRDAVLDTDTLAEGSSATVRLTLCNSGAMAGAETVQLYVADATGRPVPGGREPQALRGFQKVYLQPGETREVQFTLTARDLSWYSEALHDWYAHPGRYEVRIGHSSRDIRATLALDYHTDRLLPLAVDENTTFGELMADPRTALVVQAVLQSQSSSLMDSSDGLMSPEAMAQMLDAMPLRALTSFAGAQAAAALPGLVAALRAAAQQ